MSRTLAHLPWDVVRLTRPDLTVLHHDHRRGSCCVETLADWQTRFGPGRHNFGVGMIDWRYRNSCRPTFVGREGRQFFPDLNPPREYRKTFTRPARQLARRQLHGLKREWNTYGESDIEVEPYRPRHQAKYNWL